MCFGVYEARYQNLSFQSVFNVRVDERPEQDVTRTNNN